MRGVKNHLSDGMIFVVFCVRDVGMRFVLRVFAVREIITSKTQEFVGYGEGINSYACISFLNRLFIALNMKVTQKCTLQKEFAQLRVTQFS